MNARDMRPGCWYVEVPNHYGRFVADEFDAAQDLVLVFLDGDQDLQSRLLLDGSAQVVPAEPKEEG